MLEKKVTQLIKACSILEGDKISLEVQIKASTLKLKETSAQHEKELGKNLDLEDQMRIKNDQLINKETEIRESKIVNIFENKINKFGFGSPTELIRPT